NIFEETTDELVELNSVMGDSTGAIAKQTEAFVQLHGSLAPLTLAQQTVIDNQEKINRLFGGSPNGFSLPEDDIPALQRMRQELKGLKDLLASLTKNGYENLTDAQAEQVVSTRKLIKEK